MPSADFELNVFNIKPKCKHIEGRDDKLRIGIGTSSQEATIMIDRVWQVEPFRLHARSVQSSQLCRKEDAGRTKSVLPIGYPVG
jgi:hypothetical protein